MIQVIHGLIGGCGEAKRRDWEGEVRSLGTCFWLARTERETAGGRNAGFGLGFVDGVGVAGRIGRCRRCVVRRFGGARLRDCRLEGRYQDESRTRFKPEVVLLRSQYRAALGTAADG